MKKRIVTIVVCLVLTSGFAWAQSFVIQGKIDGLKNGMAELQVKEGGSMVMKYSTGVAEDGTFTLRGKVAAPDLYMVKVASLRGGINIFLDNSDIKIVAKSDDLSGAQITGSALQSDFAGFTDLAKAHMEQMRPLYAASNAANQANNADELTKLKVQMNELNDKQKEEKLAYIQSIIKSPVACYIVSSMVYTFEDPAKLEKLINDFDPALDDYKYVKSLKTALAKMKVTALGTLAPDFTQNDPDGKPVKLSDFRGKFVLVDFWASWCSPCRAENPNVVAAYNKYKSKNFTILGVSLDRDREAWLKAIKSDNLTWTHVSDIRYWDNEVAKLYGIQSIPSNILLDKTGRIVGKNLRGEKLEEALAKLLN